MRKLRAIHIRSVAYGAAIGTTLATALAPVPAMPGADSQYRTSMASSPPAEPSVGAVGASEDWPEGLSAACKTFTALRSRDAEGDYMTRTRRIALFCPELMRFVAERKAGSAIADAAIAYGQAVIAAHDDLAALGAGDAHYVVRDWILRTHDVDRLGIAWAILRAAEIDQDHKTDASGM